ncbi:hypothetical protein [Anaeromicrobium sediminis]|uniref:CGGC domain-containing protein n=1 Tax=Anaeromicrobium sediminis TaxID=1478221 RepID=A0A267MJ48_9FIRM|nr:hypothetical protein [Anaeromicrobium sediminis]PAB59442.1 hypothetical protein CCE28_09495 [Anaeromicrobium sediminis]
MNIGIKFCGGCNPRYERKNVFNRMKIDLEGANIELATEETRYDYIVVLGGCTNCCAEYKNLKYKREIILFVDIKQYDEMIKKLKN